MLSREDNELLTRVGQGTPMGELMRQYWIPALLSSELPSNDCNPVRVMLLGEKLIAFRDTDGRVGLIQNNCPHRGASLFFGRNSECGIRCVYHGWKFDVDGNCIDMPNEPPESDFKNKVKAVTYPCVERGGLVWAYMGSATELPPLPDIEVNQLPEEDVLIAPTLLECNWLQAVEGEIDTSHSGFLHFGSISHEDVEKGSFLYYSTRNRAPKYSVVDTEYGVMYGAYRPAEPGYLYWRIAQFMFPFFTQSPEGVLGHHVITNAWVPMDDYHTMAFIMIRKDRSDENWPQRHPLLGNASNYPDAVTPMLENTTDWFGRFRSRLSAANDYEIDRDRQRNGVDYSGIPFIGAQDRAMQESMGSIYDRTQEHLASSDSMIIRTRRRLLKTARAFKEKRIAPPGVNDPHVYRNRSGSIVLPEDENWMEATKELRTAFTEHPEVLYEP